MEKKDGLKWADLLVLNRGIRVLNSYESWKGKFNGVADTIRGVLQEATYATGPSANLLVTLAEFNAMLQVIGVITKSLPDPGLPLLFVSHLLLHSGLVV